MPKRKKPGPLPSDIRIIKFNPEEPRPIFVSRQNVPKLFVDLKAQTLANLASEGKGPRYFRRGKVAWYLVDDLVEYITGIQE